MTMELAEDYSLEPGANDVASLEGPKGQPVLGVLPRFQSDPLGFALQVSRDYGDIVPLKLGFKTVYLLNHPDLIKQVFVDNRRNYVRSDFYGALSPYFGDGLFTLDGDAHRHQRMTAMKSVRNDMLKNMVPKITEATQDLIGRLEQKALKHEAIDMTDTMAHHTLDVVMRCFFSLKITREQQKVIHDAFSVILDEIERRIWKLLPVLESVPTPQMLRVNKALKEIDNVIYGLVDKRLAMAEEDQPLDLLTYFILAEKDQASPAQLRDILRDQIFSFMLAGHETGSNSMTWTFLKLSQHPDVARRHFAELDIVLQGRTPTYEDLNALQYTNQIYYEILRLFPPGWAFSRTALEDDTMAGVHIPKGSSVMLSAYTMHRHPRFWDNPEGFDPDRFAPANAPKCTDLKYFPWGGGEHVCMGSRFSMIEGVQIFAMLGQRFEFEAVGGQSINPIPKTTIRPDRHVFMQAKLKN